MCKEPQPQPLSRRSHRVYTSPLDPSLPRFSPPCMVYAFTYLVWGSVQLGVLIYLFGLRGTSTKIAIETEKN